jgi:hypothetical protein
MKSFLEHQLSVPRVHQSIELLSMKDEHISSSAEQLVGFDHAGFADSLASAGAVGVSADLQGPAVADRIAVVVAGHACLLPVSLCLS